MVGPLVEDLFAVSLREREEKKEREERKKKGKTREGEKERNIEARATKTNFVLSTTVWRIRRRTRWRVSRRTSSSRRS